MSNDGRAAYKLSQTNAVGLADITNKSMRPVFSTTLQSAVNAVTISNDNLGKSFNLTRALLRILVPAGCSSPVGTSAFMFAKLNDITSGYKDPGNTNDNDSVFIIGAVRNLYGMVDVDMEVLVSNSAIIKSQSGYSDGTNRAANAVYVSSLLSGISSITKIYFYLGSSYTLPIGTIIELWGSNLWAN